MFWLCFFVCLSVFTINLKVVIGSLSFFFHQLGLVKEPNTLWKDPVRIQDKKIIFKRSQSTPTRVTRLWKCHTVTLALNGI